MQNQKSNRTPIIEPFLLILKSRRVITALCSLIIGALVTLLPELEAVRVELLTLLITLALAIIGGYSLEDAAHAARQRNTTLDTDIRALIHETIDALFDEKSDADK